MRIQTIVAAFVVAALLVSLSTSSAVGQMIGIETPIQNTSDSFYENVGVSGSLERDNFFFNWGGNAVPPFGGYDPNNNANVGVRFRGPKGGQFSLNLSMGQGSRRSNAVTSPSIVIPNGGSGFINNTSNRPFVTSVIPVIGGGTMVNGSGPLYGGGAYPMNFSPNPNIYGQRSQQVYTSPLIEKIQRLATEPPSLRNATGNLQRIQSAAAASSTESNRPVAPTSSAAMGDISVAEIKSQLGTADDETTRKVTEHVTKAEAYVAAKKYTLARYHLKNALKHAAVEDQTRLAERLDEVEGLVYESKNAARIARQKKTDGSTKE